MSRAKRGEHETFVLRLGHTHPWESWGRARFRIFQRFYISFSPFPGNATTACHRRFHHLPTPHHTRGSARLGAVLASAGGGMRSCRRRGGPVPASSHPAPV